MTRIHSINKLQLSNYNCYEEENENKKNTTYFHSNNSLIYTSQFHASYGSIMPGRYFSSGTGYRYGFNTQLKDDEISGNGNHTTALFWEYDTRLGRRWNVDPITYPWHSSYIINNGNPIIYYDPLGLFGSRKEAREYLKANKSQLSGRTSIHKDRETGLYNVESKYTTTYKDKENNLHSDFKISVEFIAHKNKDKIANYAGGKEFGEELPAENKDFNAPVIIGNGASGSAVTPPNKLPKGKRIYMDFHLLQEMADWLQKTFGPNKTPEKSTQMPKNPDGVMEKVKDIAKPAVEKKTEEDIKNENKNINPTAPKVNFKEDKSTQISKYIDYYIINEDGTIIAGSKTVPMNHGNGPDTLDLRKK